MSSYSGLLSAELAATCNSLGFKDGNEYHLEPHTIETLKDIIRYLRRDEESHEIRLYLGRANVLRTDLLPMVQSHHADLHLFDVALRLIVNLTNPALLVYNEVIPTEKMEHNQYLELSAHLRNYKQVFNDQNAWAPFADRLSALLNKAVEDRDDDDQRTIERILILVRNILHVPSLGDSDWRPDNDANIQDQVLWALHQCRMFDLLLYITSAIQESHFYFHLLEIINLMFREQPPSVLAQTASQRSIEEKTRDDRELLSLRLHETQNKLKKNIRFMGTRHSNFGGTFIIKNMKSTSDSDVIYHKPLNAIKTVSLDQGKKKVKIPKNRQPLKCENTERRSALSVRLILKEFCVEILNGSYNPLMKHVRECFFRGTAQANDESLYFSAVKFFMEFNRHYKFEVKFVSETLSVQTFQFIHKYLETWYEMMTTDKKKFALWSTRMHGALKAYKELLENLVVMDKSEERSVRESSKVIKSNIFYVLEYREMLSFLIKTYNKTKHSRQYLIDLVETNHIFLKLLGDFANSRQLIVQKKGTRKNRKSKKKPKKPEPRNQKAVEEMWNAISGDVAGVLSTSNTREVIPFDATLDLTMDEHKLEAIKKIQRLIKSGDNVEAVSLLRASREVWPEQDTFGAINVSSEEELNILKDIFLEDFGKENEPPAREEINDDDESSSGIEDEEDDYPVITEQKLDMMDLVKRLVSPKVIHICVLLLDTFETNSVFTNHCIAKLLHRIAWDCKIPGMLFQASLLIKFQQILKSGNPKYKELAGLAIFTIRKLVEVANVNKLVFVELLFYKQARDACELEQGYGSFQDKGKTAGVWEEHEEDELRRLYDEYKDKKPKERYIDWIMDNIIDKDRSRKAVTKKIKELGLEIQDRSKNSWEEREEDELKRLFNEVDQSLDPKSIVSFIFDRFSNKEKSQRAVKQKLIELELLSAPEKKVKFWTEIQEDELRSIFNEFKNSRDVLADVMGSLTVPRSKQNVIAALLRLGLIQDKKEVLKRKSNKKEREPIHDEVESSDESGSDSEDEIEEIIPTLSAAVTALHSTHDKNLCEGLKWISSCLEDCLEDLDEGSVGSQVPLLPLAEESVLSIENQIFQNLLQSLGFHKPNQQQEIYWRVPASWTGNKLEQIMELLNCLAQNWNSEIQDFASKINEIIRLISGVDDLDVMREVSRQNTAEYDTEMDTESFDLLIKKHCRETLANELNNSSEEDTTDAYLDDPGLPAASLRGNPLKGRNVISDESSDGESTPLRAKSSKPIRKSQSVRKPKRMVEDSSSDDEPGMSSANMKLYSTQENDGSNHSSSPVRATDSSSKRFRNTLDSDNESEDNNEKSRKRRFVIESDDDD